MCPGRRLYAIAGTLADARGQNARKVFAGLFEIDWDGKDLAVLKPATVTPDGQGSFHVREMGSVRLFLDNG